MLINVMLVKKKHVLMKPDFPIGVILICDPIHLSHLSTILMLCDCVGERLTLEVILRYSPYI